MVLGENAQNLVWESCSHETMVKMCEIDLNRNDRRERKVKSAPSKVIDEPIHGPATDHLT